MKTEAVRILRSIGSFHEKNKSLNWKRKGRNKFRPLSENDLVQLALLGYTINSESKFLISLELEHGSSKYPNSNENYFITDLLITIKSNSGEVVERFMLSVQNHHRTGNVFFYTCDLLRDQNEDILLESESLGVSNFARLNAFLHLIDGFVIKRRSIFNFLKNTFDI